MGSGVRVGVRGRVSRGRVRVGVRVRVRARVLEAVALLEVR